MNNSEQTASVVLCNTSVVQETKDHGIDDTAYGLSGAGPHPSEPPRASV